MKLFLISMMGTVVLLFFNHFHRLIVMLCFRRAFSLHKVLFVRTFLLHKKILLTAIRIVVSRISFYSFPYGVGSSATIKGFTSGISYITGFVTFAVSYVDSNPRPITASIHSAKAIFSFSGFPE